MYLFQPFQRFQVCLMLLYLHSNMYLFQQKRKSHKKSLTIIYIPICTYFNHLPRTGVYLYQVNLHSNMYLFQPIPRQTAVWAAFYLHSNMYLFQQDSNTNGLSNDTNLHSNMYLFQPAGICAVDNWALVFTFQYVPISTCPRRRKKRCQNCIYIPICTYFNA